MNDNTPGAGEKAVGGRAAVPARNDSAATIWSAVGALVALQNEMPPIARFGGAGAAPLSFAQERLWLLEESESGAPYYNVPLCWEIHGDLVVSALERSLDLLTQRHEVLRASFPKLDG